FRALRIGRASWYEMGMDGMLGMAVCTGWRGAPGLDGYPGVVLSNMLEKLSPARAGRQGAIRIARAKAEELGAASLHAARIAGGPVGVRLLSFLFGCVAVVAGVAVQD